MYTYRRRLASAVSAAFLTAVAASAMAASHSDAPRIKQDPQANLTDVYAFVGTRYDDPSEQVLNVVVNVRPFSEPGDGVIYDRFADDALYSIHITDPSTGVGHLVADCHCDFVIGVCDRVLVEQNEMDAVVGIDRRGDVAGDRQFAAG